MHYMSVQKRYYDMLKYGKKTVELRLFDEKRQKIKMGDYILFTNTEDMTDSFQGKVINLYWEKDFNSLAEKIQPVQAGFQTKNELIATMQTFYPTEKQLKFGVIGIEIMRV